MKINDWEAYTKIGTAVCSMWLKSETEGAGTRGAKERFMEWITHRYDQALQSKERKKLATETTTERAKWPTSFEIQKGEDND